MEEKYNKESKLFWKQMDCSKLDFEDEYFDIIIDKATFDAILCGNEYKDIISSSLSECFRTLKKDGLLIVITCGLFIPNLNNNEFYSKKMCWKLLKYSSFKNPQKHEQTNHIYIFKKISINKFKTQNTTEEVDFITSPDDILLKILSDE